MELTGLPRLCIISSSIFGGIFVYIDKCNNNYINQKVQTEESQELMRILSDNGFADSKVAQFITMYDKIYCSYFHATGDFYTFRAGELQLG